MAILQHTPFIFLAGTRVELYLDADKYIYIISFNIETHFQTFKVNPFYFHIIRTKEFKAKH